MGTRASFWIGDPRNIDSRNWLGCIAFDGYVEGLNGLEGIKSRTDFVSLVNGLEPRSDFAFPSLGWPFPWDDDIFITDYTYAWFDERLNIAIFHNGWYSLDEVSDEGDKYKEKTDALPRNIPAPSRYNPRQPDSIIIITREQ